MARILIVLVAIVPMLAIMGCSGDLPTSSSASAAESEIVGDSATGSLRVSIGQAVNAERIADHAGWTHAQVMAKRDADDVQVGGTLTLVNGTNLSGTISGLPAGVDVYAHAVLYVGDPSAGGTQITTGDSPVVTVVAARNIAANITLGPTVPTFANLTPANGQVVSGSEINISCQIVDNGGSLPQNATLTLDTIGQGSLANTFFPLWDVGRLANGTHNVTVSATTASGGTDSVLWSFDVINILDDYAAYGADYRTCVGNVLYGSDGAALGYNASSIIQLTHPNQTSSKVTIYCNTGSSPTLQVVYYVDLTTGLQLVGSTTQVKVNGAVVATTAVVISQLEFDPAAGTGKGRWQIDSLLIQRSGYSDISGSLAVNVATVTPTP